MADGVRKSFLLAQLLELPKTEHDGDAVDGFSGVKLTFYVRGTSTAMLDVTAIQDANFKIASVGSMPVPANTTNSSR